MPKLTVNEASIAYELHGSGPTIVWNAGGRSGRTGIGKSLARRLSNRYTVLEWDRRNSAGESDLSLSDARTFTEADTDDLHGLLQALDLGPACIGGGSAGCALSLAMAHRHPDDVKGLLLFNTPTTDQNEIRLRANARWVELAEAAERGGMRATVAFSTHAMERLEAGTPMDFDQVRAWLGQTIRAYPPNGERAEDMDADRFARMARCWGDTMAANTWHWLGGATEEETRSLPFPAIVVPGDDPIHPRESASRLAGMLPNADLVDYPPPVTVKNPWPERQDALLPTIEDFLSKTFT